MHKIISKLLGLAGYKVIKGAELDKLQYQIKHKAQTKLDNHINPLGIKKVLLKNVEYPVIFDVGAYIGTTAIEYAKIFHKGIVYAFEPTSNTFEQLKNNSLAINNIKPYNMAVSDFDGETKFFINKFAPTNSLLPPDRLADEHWGKDLLRPDKVAKVKSARLNTFCSAERISRIDLLKLDVQGAELSVLKGASHLIDEGRIGLIYAEVIFVPTYEHQSIYYELGQYLADKGYYLHSLYNLAYDGNRIKQADFLFIKG